jgi:hypothetical protein
VGTIAGTFAQRPSGCILHGSRSGQGWDVPAEFKSTRTYASNGAGGLGWHATVGEERLADGLIVPAYSVHMTARHWGWSARSESSKKLAIEFSQARLGNPISDDQIAAWAHWYEHEVVPVWGELDLDDDSALPFHSELSQGISDGKSDTWPRFNAEGDDMRRRIRAAIG